MSQTSPRRGEYSSTLAKAFKTVGRTAFCGSVGLSELSPATAAGPRSDQTFSRLGWAAKVFEKVSFEPATGVTERRPPKCQLTQAACTLNSNPITVRGMRIRAGAKMV